MRPRFEETLRTYSALAQDKRQTSSKEARASGQFAQLNAAIEWHIAQTAKRRGSGLEIQQMIFRLQERKQKIMARLKQDLAAVSADTQPREQHEDARRVSQQGDELVVEDRLGGSAPLDLGSLMTDGDWGVHYNLDPQTTPRTLRKKYLIEEAKRKLWNLLNTQILEDELHSSHTHEFKRATYERIKTDESAGEKAGLIAEKMVRNFLRKLTLNYGLDFEVEPADVYQDVEQKIDFIIKRTLRTRGVRVDEHDPEEKVGVQFTISTLDKTLKGKRRQIERAMEHMETPDIEDILLVSIPLSSSREILRQWEAEGSPSGGPDALWTDDMKRTIFHEVLKGFFTSEEIEAQWRVIEGRTAAPRNPFALAA